MKFDMPPIGVWLALIAAAIYFGLGSAPVNAAGDFRCVCIVEEVSQ